MKNSKISKITIKGKQIRIILDKNNDDFISLTDMAKFKTYDSGIVIANWLTTKYTIQFMGAWEQMHNPNFNLMEFHKIKKEDDNWGTLPNPNWTQKGFQWDVVKEYIFANLQI